LNGIPAPITFDMMQLLHLIPIYFRDGKKPVPRHILGTVRR